MAPMPIGHDKLLNLIIELAQLHKVPAVHFRWAYTSDGRRMTAYKGDGAGYPDLLLVPASGPVWREIKTGTARLEPAQIIWQDRLTAAGCDVGVWRDTDWHAGRIQAEIQAMARARRGPAGTSRGPIPPPLTQLPRIMGLLPSPTRHS